MKKATTKAPAVTAIIVAAGDGTRMKSSKNKQFLSLGGVPVLARTLAAFQAAATVKNIIVVTKPELIPDVSIIAKEFGITKADLVVAGGATRQDSVLNGISEAKDCRLIAIHDGARPFVTPALIDSVVETATKTGAAAPGIIPKDTVKIVADEGLVESTPERSALRLIQTPQVFDFEKIKYAYLRAQSSDFEGTDDCSVAENAGIPVTIIPGEQTNIKITTPEDLPMGEAILGFLNK